MGSPCCHRPRSPRWASFGRTAAAALVLPMRWRYGYHMVGTTRGRIDAAFGHFGFGGLRRLGRPLVELAVAMVCNRGSGTPIGDVRLLRLGTAAMAALGELRRKG